MPRVNWGATYLDHYERYLQRDPAQRWVFAAGGASLQVLAYDRVFPGCRVFTTLGLTHFRARLNMSVELVTAVDDGLEAVPEVLANAALYLATEGRGFSRGHALSGVENIDAAFARRFKKTAIYLCPPQGFPEAFDVVCGGEEHAIMTFAMFISTDEFAALTKLGFEAFEEALASQHVDPLALARPSAVFPGSA